MSETKLLVPLRRSNGTYEVLEALPDDMNWPELRAIWSDMDVSMPLCFAPPEEKLELFFYYACEAHGVPSSLGTVYNPGLTGLYLESGEHDCLVISATLARYFIENALFAAYVKQLKQLVFVGSLSLDQQGILKDRFAEQFLCIAHPKKALRAGV